jgi:hypothetical protein
MHLTEGYYEIIGSVKDDKSVKALTSIELGPTLGKCHSGRTFSQHPIRIQPHRSPLVHLSPFPLSSHEPEPVMYKANG